MGLFKKMDKKSEFENVDAPTVDVVKEERVSKEDKAKSEALLKDLYGGPYSLANLENNPIVISVIQTNLLYRLLKEQEKTNALIQELGGE